MSTDPRLRLAARRAGADPLAAAVRLEQAADAMRAHLTTQEPEPERSPEVLDQAEVWRDPGPAPAPDPAPMTPDPDPAPVPSNAPPAFISEHPRDDRRAGDAPEWAPPLEVLDPRRPVLNWRPRHDPRSRRFGIRRALTGSAPLQPVNLPNGPVLDQGNEGACVGFAAAGAANVLRLERTGGGVVAQAGPMLDAGDALELYRLAQRLDDEPGESYVGTSVLAGMKAGQQRGLWGGYLWCFGTRDIAQTLLSGRPVVAGVPWAESMYDTGPRGVVTIGDDPLNFGHCLILTELALTGPNGEPGAHFGWQNSWGPDYGDEGIGWIAHRLLADLLHRHGEAAVPTPDPQTAP